MATQKIFFECGFCKRLYDEESQAVACESHHETLAEFTVMDALESRSEGCFPEKILLRHGKHDELLAEYTLSRKGNIIDFYQTEEQWHHI